MRCLVTGCAGFIGSHLAERLCEDGHDVTGIDAFVGYYAREVKECNIAGLRTRRNFCFVEANLLAADLPALVRDASWVFHLAAQAGVRSSWGAEFNAYTDNNILATQRLLEACKDAPALESFVYASSSSVYGDAETMPTPETMTPQPISPYGVTKLAGEHLCMLYHANYGVPVVALRFFTVYGPRQRPDMAFHKFIRAMIDRTPITVYGDGQQTRDYTYIGDVVNANILAARFGPSGEVYNISSEWPVSLREVIRLLQLVLGDAIIRQEDVQHGDVHDTSADITKARRGLHYEPKHGFPWGLSRQIAWMRA